MEAATNTDLIEHILLRTAVFAAFGSAAMAVHLVALRFVAWDPVPASALSQVQWWKRHARAFLLTSLMITAGALTGLVVLAVVR